MIGKGVHKGRNYGVDALKVASMMGILLLHLIGHGKIVDACAHGTSAHILFRAISVICLCSVNCYALITGYLNYGKRTRYSRIALLWLRVLFYSVSITVLFALFMPDAVGRNEWVKAFFPVMTNQYWYFTSYFLLFFIAPFVNIEMDKWTRPQLAMSCISLMLVSSVFPVVFRRDVFWLMNGFSVLWLLVLYIIGQTVRVAETVFARRDVFIWAMVSLLASISTVFVLDSMGKSHTSFYDLMTSYISPLVLCTSVMLLLLFKDFKIGNRTGRLLAFLSPLTFSVYLIHDNELVRHYLVSGRFAIFAQLPGLLAVIAVLLFAVVVFALCIAIDLTRVKLFDMVRLEKVLKYIFND